MTHWFLFLLIALSTLVPVAAAADDKPELQVLLGRKYLDLSWWNSGFVSAKGTWIFTNDKIANPIQTTEIQCHKSRGICIEAVAYLDDGEFLRVGVEVYEIALWDSVEIITEPLKSSLCTRYIKRFNRVQQSVTGTRSTVSTTGECQGVENKELHLELVDGIELLFNSLTKQPK
jgi:hypothetical protein